MTPPAHELGATLGQWNALVRRARMTDRQKLAALLISSYANAKGRDIHCGAARLAVDMGASYRTARRYLAWLREIGLIELVKAGNRRRGRSDEYRLILGPDVLEDLDVPDPDRYAALCREVADANQGTSRVSPEMTLPRGARTIDQGSPKVSLDADDQGTTYVSLDGADQGTPIGDPPPSTKDLPSLRRSTFQADDGDLRTAAHPSRASAEEPPNPEPSPRPTKCPDGLSAAMRPDGKPECPICRRRLSRPGIEIPSPPSERIAPVIDLHTREVS